MVVAPTTSATCAATSVTVERPSGKIAMAAQFVPRWRGRRKTVTARLRTMYRRVDPIDGSLLVIIGWVLGTLGWILGGYFVW